MPPPTGHPLGGTCATDPDCASGPCVIALGTGFCSAGCTSDADCATTSGARYVCGVGPGGAPLCVPPCGTSRYTCVAGVSTDCSLVTDDSHCIDCRCADTTQHCLRDVGCFPPADVGGPCHQNSDCISRNCSTFHGTCRVAVGAACTTDDCDECLHLPTGGTHCSRECRSVSDCNGDACVGDAALLHYECRPPACTGSTSTCTVEVSPHEVAEACHADTDCRSGLCFSAPRCVGSDCIGEGWCTAPCTGDADCASGASCVMVPCAAGQTAACGTVCLHSCTGFTDCGVYGGACSGLETPAHALASVCDVRHASGGVCARDQECLSAHCVSGTCT